MQITALKSDYKFSHDYSYIACQTRDGDLDTFFKHENQNTPLPLSLGGKIRLGTKGDLLHCLQLEKIQEMNAHVVNAKFFDGAVIVQMLRSRTAKSMLVQYSQLESVE